MNEETVAAYKRVRGHNNPAFHGGWAETQALLRGVKLAETIDDEESLAPLELSRNERIVFEVIRVARPYEQLEMCGVLERDDMRAFLHALIEAQLAVLVDAATAKNLVALEINRARAKVTGKTTTSTAIPSKKAITARVYRPDISRLGSNSRPDSSVVSGLPSGTGSSAEKPLTDAEIVEMEKLRNRALTDEERQLIKSVEIAYALMRTQSHYEFLGVARDAQATDIKKAYMDLARRWHPDMLTGGALSGNDTFKTKVDALFGRLMEANKALGSAGARKLYDMELVEDTFAGSGVKSGEERPRNPEQALVMYEKGDTFLKKGDWRNGETHLRAAADLDPENAVFQVAYAWAINTNELREKSQRAKQAQRKLEECWTRMKFPDAAVKLAILLGEQGKDRQAKEILAEALKLNPDHEEGKRELKILETRVDKKRDDRRAKKDEETKKTKSGLFAKLLNR